MLSGADINVADICNVTPILTASYGRVWSTVQILFELGAKTHNISTFDGKCILHNIAYFSDKDLPLKIIEATKDLVNHQYAGSNPT